MGKNGSNIRTSGILSTELPLTSKRVRFILSNSDDSKKLSAATRARKRGRSRPFRLSVGVRDKM
jgi:hypothetical protein